MPTANLNPGRLVRTYWFPLLLVAVITLAHYNTAFHIHALHGIYRRLYYFPIIVAAFRGGTSGGLTFALLVCAVYLPHALGYIGFDPGTPVEKALEMVLYVAVGLLAGILVSRANAARRRLENTASDLRVALAEKTAMEAELVRSARLAAVGRLSAGLAHEIRNPLASIQGSAEVIADDFPADHPKSRLLGIMLDETGRLNDVLTRFLAFARSEPGELAAFDLGAECRAVAELVSHRPDAPAVEVDVPAEPSLMARGNREQIRQVILNLALNGLDAGGPDGTLTLTARAEGGHCVARVCDTGPGFSAEGVANFGTPFYSTRAGGTGLGLATSLRITEDLGGSLAVDPDHESGGCVVLRLPAAGQTA